MKKIVVLQWLLASCVAIIVMLCVALKVQERKLQWTWQELVRSDQMQGQLAAELSGSVKSPPCMDAKPALYGRGNNRFRTTYKAMASDVH